MRFRYLLDPLFLICFALYCVNRWVLKPQMPGSFFTSHLNDLMCIPFCVPIMLFMLRVLRLRTDDSPPHSYEIVVPLLLWAAMFEIWLPSVPFFRGLATRDHRDVLYYTIGALIAGVVWKAYYRKERTTKASPRGDGGHKFASLGSQGDRTV